MGASPATSAGARDAMPPARRACSVVQVKEERPRKSGGFVGL